MHLGNLHGLVQFSRGGIGNGSAFFMIYHVSCFFPGLIYTNIVKDNS